MATKRKLDSEESTSGIKPGADYSFTGRPSTEFQQALQSALQDAVKSVDEELMKSVNEKNLAYTLTRAGEKVYLDMPSRPNGKDPLERLIVLLASKLPHSIMIRENPLCVFPHNRTASPELLKMLCSAATALDNPVKSFAFDENDPASVTRTGIWISACRYLAACPSEEVKGLHWSVLPPKPKTKGKGNKDTVWVSRMGGAIRQCYGDEGENLVNTVSTLFLMWYRESSTKAAAYELVRAQRIPFSLIQNRVMEKKQKKNRKKEEISFYLFPPNPSHSPWLAKDEQKFGSVIVSPEWTYIGDQGSAWGVLTPQEQHASFKLYLDNVQKNYQAINSMAKRMGIAIGGRKSIMNQAFTKCKTPIPKPQKKGEVIGARTLSDLFWRKAAHFTALTNGQKMAFNPSAVLQGAYKSDECLAYWNRLGQGGTPVFTTDITVEKRDRNFPGSDDLYLWFQWWERKFAPEPNKEPALAPKAQVELSNRFSALETGETAPKRTRIAPQEEVPPAAPAAEDIPLEDDLDMDDF